MLLFRFVGSFVLRFADRQFAASLFDSPESVTKKVKGNVATALRSDGIQNVWSRGWFVRSNGNATDEVIRNYVANQFDHHRAKPLTNPSIMTNCRCHNQDDASQIRKSSHAAFQYNIHFVFSVRRRIEFLDPIVGQKLVQYWLSVCQKKSCADVFSFNRVGNAPRSRPFGHAVKRDHSYRRA